MSYLFVFLGGGIGSVLRFYLSSVVYTPINVGRFPLKTFFVNMLGCLAIGFFSALFVSMSVRAEVKNFLVAGFCGGFTTFSTFSRETYDLWASGHVSVAIIYSVVSVVLGALLVWLAYGVAGRIV